MVPEDRETSRSEKKECVTNDTADSISFVFMSFLLHPKFHRGDVEVGPAKSSHTVGLCHS